MPFASKSRTTSANYKFSGHSRGFSLVELMIALALSVFLTGALILTYTSGSASAREAENLARVQENMRFLSDHLLRDVRNAGFRDQLTLTIAEYIDIGSSYAEIQNSGDSLVIRYAGRSHCAQARPDLGAITSELTVVENRYFSDNGRLRCAGVVNKGETDENSGATDLVNGVQSISFALIRPSSAASTSDVCDFDGDLDEACTGVEMTVTFEGLGSSDDRTAVFRAAFRNVLVDRVFERES